MDEAISKDIHYRNISLLVRPARLAILIDATDEYWKHTILNIFEWCGRVWGGAYFLIVPTDGKEIKNLFWQILEEYSPDLVYAYRPTIEDLETADPDYYAKVIDSYRQAIKKQFPYMEEEAFQDFFNRDVRPKRRSNFNVEPPLQNKIKQNLAPFYFQDYVVQEKISASKYVPFPLTELEKIAVDGRLEQVWLADKIADIDCSLAFYSNWGRYDEKYAEVLAQKGIKIERIPDNIRLGDLLAIGIRNRIDQSDITLRSYFKGESWYPSENIIAYSPYQASLMKLGRYRNTERDIQNEPSILIIGDDIFDFCLYYCLSRFQDQVYWLPELRIQASMKNISDYDDKDVLNATVLAVVNLHDSHESTSKNTQIASVSLTVEQLEEIKKAIPNYIHVSLDSPDELLMAFVVDSKVDISQKYFYRYIEQNNYTSQYTEVFENNRGIGNIQTPKPKNFGQINPSEHRWITELNIDGYIPPPLHFL
jgi:hypothetical protein